MDDKMQDCYSNNEFCKRECALMEILQLGGISHCFSLNAWFVVLIGTW